MRVTLHRSAALPAAARPAATAPSALLARFARFALAAASLAASVLLTPRVMDGQETRAASRTRVAAVVAVAAPDPTLAPEEVVGIVLDAFAHADAEREPMDGVDVAYAFTAPANRAAIGSVDRFRDVVREGSYRPLLGHTRAVRGAVKVDGERATQRVVVTSAQGSRVVYTFTLSRQIDGEYKGCWMTERVLREPPSSLAAPLLTR